jgi:hypothetical protein
LNDRPGGSIRPFCEPGDRDVDAPGVVAIVDRAQRGDGVDQQQRGVPGGIDGAADGADVAHHTGRGFVVDDAHRLDRVAGVFLQALLDRRRDRRACASRRP